MHGDKILQAADTHRSFLVHTGVTPIRAPEDLIVPNAEQAYSHLLWLLREVPGFVEADRIQKAMRWVCFSQGVLWDRGLTTTRVLKDLMRPDGSFHDHSA